MGLRVNGSELPWSFVVSVCVGIFWLSGLSYTAAENTKKIQEINSADRLARIEEKQKNIKEDVEDIKDKLDAAQDIARNNAAKLDILVRELQKDD